MSLSSPREWGCFWIVDRGRCSSGTLPHVSGGVSAVGLSRSSAKRPLPHVSGGVSINPGIENVAVLLFPT